MINRAINLKERAIIVFNRAINLKERANKVQLSIYLNNSCQ